MKRAFILAGLATALLASCKSSKNKSLEGAYAFEEAYDTQSGKETRRDTIFLQQSDNGYQVSQHRWQNNAYDTQGWHTRNGFGNQPYTVKYDEQLSSLVEPNNFAPPIKVSANQKELILKDKTFQKVIAQ